MLGTDEVYRAPSQTGSLSLRAAEEWKRCVCEKTFSMLSRVQECRTYQDGGEMLVSIALNHPLEVENPNRFNI